MSRTVVSLVAAMAMCGLWSSQAMAQRDVGAKARGEFGKGFWSSSKRSSANRSYSYSQPMQSAQGQYRSFSYEPVEYKAGDSVIIDRENSRLMVGKQTLGTLSKDTKFKVIKVTRGWLGAEVQVNGQKRKGWVWHDYVRMNQQQESAPAPEPAPAPAPPKEG